VLKPADFLRRYGRKYSDILGIDVRSGRNSELFKWFLASILFAKPIREEEAIRTYRCFVAHGVVSPRKIIETGWQGLVDILDEGKYTRYDFSTADKLLEVMSRLETEYGGDINRIHKLAADSEDLEARIKALGKGIGDTTVGIFLREAQVCWKKAKPKPTPLEKLAMKRLGIKDAASYWSKHKVRGGDIASFQTALARYGREIRRKK
jgi:hypothetical protein